jgi:hypothetical protein
VAPAGTTLELTLLALASSVGNVHELVLQSHSSLQSVSLLRLDKVHGHMRECPSAYITNLRGIHAIHAIVSTPCPAFYAPCDGIIGYRVELIR